MPGLSLSACLPSSLMCMWPPCLQCSLRVHVRAPTPHITAPTHLPPPSQDRSALISCRLMKLGGEIFFHTRLAALIEAPPPPPPPPPHPLLLPPLYPSSCCLSLAWLFDVEMKAEGVKKASQWVKLKATVLLAASPTAQRGRWHDLMFALGLLVFARKRGGVDF